MEVPAEDRQHTVGVSPIREVPAVEDDDPKVAEDRAAWSAATRKAQALHTADELLRGLRHHDWRVRHASVARLVARAHDDERTLPALLQAATHDVTWQVRDAVVFGLLEFDTGAVFAVLQAAAHDPYEEVRWSAQFALFQKGLGEYPGPLGPVCDFFDGHRATSDE